MKLKDLDLNKSYTYADYLTWFFEERIELIKGKIFKMSPAPNTYHQEISGNLFFKVKYFLGGKKCKVFSAPFDLRLPLPLDKTKDNSLFIKPKGAIRDVWIVFQRREHLFSSFSRVKNKPGTYFPRFKPFRRALGGELH